MSFQRNQRTCNFDQCPLCANQSNFRFKPIPLDQDPDFIKRVQDPFDICNQDRGLVPPACAIDSSKFNSAVLIFVWLMIAFWISMMVLMSFDDRTYLAIGRQGTGTGLGTYFTGARGNAGIFGSNSRNDVFSLICIVVCILNVVMVLNRMMSCGSPPPDDGGVPPGGVPMGMQGYALRDIPPVSQVLPAISEEPEMAETAAHPMDDGGHQRHSSDINLTSFDTSNNVSQAPTVVRSNQFLQQPEDTFSESDVSSFLTYGPNSLRMDSIVKQKGARLSQCGDEEMEEIKRPHQRMFGNNKSRLSYDQSFGKKVREVLKKRPTFPLLKAPAPPSTTKTSSTERMRAKSVKEIQPPVLGKGKPVTDKDMDMIGRRANKVNECYVPTSRSVFLTKSDHRDLSGEGGHFLGRLRTSPDEDPNEGSEVSIMERWNNRRQSWIKNRSTTLNSLTC